MIKTRELFDLSHTLAAPLLQKTEYPWEALDDLAHFILSLGPSLSSQEYDHPSEGIWIARSAQISPSAHVGAPCIIGPETQIRHSAFIRGSALIGKGAVIGNSTELKNVIFMDGVQAPHFNYVGDSILGHRAHLGAGAITSNVKSDQTPIAVQGEKSYLPTGRKKLGAMIGDEAEIGCNAVLNPGAVLGPRCIVYPLSCVRGLIPPDHIFKGNRGLARREKNHPPA